MKLKDKIQLKLYNYMLGGSDLAATLHNKLSANRLTGLGEDSALPLLPLDMLDLYTYTGLSKAYDECSVVSTIVSRIATAVTNGELGIIDTKTKVKNSYNYDSVFKVLRKPNSSQSFNEFIESLLITAGIYGRAIVYTPKVIGISSVTSLHVLHPGQLVLEYDAPYIAEDYIKSLPKAMYLQFGNKLQEVQFDEIHIFIDAPDSSEFITGMSTTVAKTEKLPVRSRLSPLSFEVQNIIQAQESIYVLNKDRGAQGILSNDKKDAAGYLPLTASEKNELNREYYASYGTRLDTKKVIITDASVKWQPMSYSVKDLMLFEGIKSNMCSIADAYNYPFELLANDKGSTFSNRDAAMKALYQDKVIPVANKVSGLFGQIFKLRAGHEFAFDYSDVAVMQESAKDKAVAQRGVAQAMHVMFQNGVITKEEFRRACGMSDVVFGKEYIDSNLVSSGSVRVNGQAPAGTGINNNDVMHNE